MDGVINLLKPAGMTSHDAVSACRRILRMKKIGHTGTLDPMACGVLAICVGKGTRAAEYLESDEKSYRCELRLGLTSDTGDIWGTVSEEGLAAAARVTADEVLAALESMKGPQLQYPPMYSAVRVGGRKLYEYARKGEAVEVKPREITIRDIRPVRVLEEPGVVLFDVDCSKGTYVRTICTDLGEKLGCGAAMSFLLRTASGQFRLENAVCFEDLLAAVSAAEGMTPQEILDNPVRTPLTVDLSRFIQPLEQVLARYDAVHLQPEDARRFVNGNPIRLPRVRQEAGFAQPVQGKFADLCRVFGPENSFLGTARIDRHKGLVTADKVLYR